MSVRDEDFWNLELLVSSTYCIQYKYSIIRILGYCIALIGVQYLDRIT